MGKRYFIVMEVSLILIDKLDLSCMILPNRSDNCFAVSPVTFQLGNGANPEARIKNFSANYHIGVNSLNLFE